MSPGTAMVAGQSLRGHVEDRELLFDINRSCEFSQRFSDMTIIITIKYISTFHCPITVNFHYLGPIHINICSALNCNIFG